MKKYITATAVGLVLAVVTYLKKAGSYGTDVSANLAVLSDCLFVPGILLIGFGLLIFVASDGLFDMFSYGMSKMLKLIEFKKKDSDDGPKDFFEYKQLKHSGKKPVYKNLLIVGSVFTLLAVIAFLLSENV